MQNNSFSPALQEHSDRNASARVRQMEGYIGRGRGLKYTLLSNRFAVRNIPLLSAQTNGAAGPLRDPRPAPASGNASCVRGQDRAGRGALQVQSPGLPVLGHRF